MKLNREWHEANRMPLNATLDQRITWHLAHAQRCACRPIPAKLAAQMAVRVSRQDVEAQTMPSAPSQGGHHQADLVPDW